MLPERLFDMELEQRGFYTFCLLLLFICDALRDLMSFVQFKKREKDPWRSVTLTPLLVFFTFLKLCKWYKIASLAKLYFCEINLEKLFFWQNS